MALERPVAVINVAKMTVLVGNVGCGMEHAIASLAHAGVAHATHESDVLEDVDALGNFARDRPAKNRGLALELLPRLAARASSLSHWC